MSLGAILIFTLTLVVSSEAENSTNTTSSFNACYFKLRSSQCPSGEDCTIVPPMNSTVRRRNLHRDPSSLEASWLNFGIRRRRSRGRSSSRSRGRSSSRSSRGTTSSLRPSSPSSSGGFTGWRYSNSISQSSYGSTARGITSTPASYSNNWFWWDKSPLPYYRYRQSNKNVNDLHEGQGICIKSGELQKMTKQDCYNWCMSYEYDDGTCAKDCGLTKGTSNNTIKIVIITLLVICLVAVLCYWLIKYRVQRSGDKTRFVSTRFLSRKKKSFREPSTRAQLEKTCLVIPDASAVKKINHKI